MVNEPTQGPLVDAVLSEVALLPENHLGAIDWEEVDKMCVRWFRSEYPLFVNARPLRFMVKYEKYRLR